MATRSNRKRVFAWFAAISGGDGHATTVIPVRRRMRGLAGLDYESFEPLFSTKQGFRHTTTQATS